MEGEGGGGGSWARLVGALSWGGRARGIHSGGNGEDGGVGGNWGLANVDGLPTRAEAHGYSPGVPFLCKNGPMGLVLAQEGVGRGGGVGVR